jgi:polysaccharide biosynthesis protein PslH
MNILFITTKSPWPLNDGHSLRSYNLLRQAAREHSIHLLSFVKYQEEKLGCERLREICSSVQLIDVPANRSSFLLARDILKSLLLRRPAVVEKYDIAAMRKAIRVILEKEDIHLVHLDMLPLACYMEHLQGYPVLLNEHNVESLLLGRKAEHLNTISARLFFSLQRKWLERFEHKAVAAADHVISCSEIDADILRGFSTSTPVTTVPNGVDTVYFSPRQENSTSAVTLVFIGGLNWYPNRDAMQWFDERILPLVLHELPEIKLHLIGQGCAISWRHRGNIVCHNAVDDIRPYMNPSAVFIVPLRIGGGTRLKILNAMAMAVAVVSTTIGAEGLQVTDGEDICLADREQSFAEAIVRLALSAEERCRIGSDARRTILDHYTWDSIGAKLRTVYAACTRNMAGDCSL